MEAMGGLVAMLVGFLFVAIVFLVCRAIVLWYWKIDKVVSLLESIDAKLIREATNGTK